MAATATATSTAPARRAAARAAARKATAGKSATRKRTPVRTASQPARRRRRTGHTPITGFVPIAVGRTAGAVGGIADSGLVVRLTRSRLWIGLLGGLLVGIVALNVIALSFSASSSDAARQAEELKRQNSALRGDIATRLSSPEIQAAAAKLGLFNPEAGSIRYLRPSPDDAAEAARRLRAGELGAADYVTPVAGAPVAPDDAVPIETAPTETAPVQTEPVETAPVADPAAAAPEASAQTAAPEVPAALEDAATSAPVDGGGVTAP